METVTLRVLVRDPIKVKKWTRAGKAVQVTDRGEPLWVIRSAGTEEENIPAGEIDKELAEMLREPKSKISASRLVLESRR
jgi:hypothetical protein